MNSENKKVFIITRRWKENDNTLLNTTKYPLSNLNSMVLNSPISNINNLASFWLQKFICKLPTIAETRINQYIDWNNNWGDGMDKYESIKTNIYDNNILNFTQSFVNYIFDEFNKIQTQHFNTNFLTHIHQLKNNNNDTSIFIYHHWLDKQGLNLSDRREFLKKLRNEVKKILNASNYSYNWLIHDNDILDNNYDGLLWFGIDNSSKTSFHPNLNDFYLKRLIPDDLHDDNIWCFVHQEEINSYYKNVIQNMDTEFCKSAENLYNYLVLDKDGIERRWSVLEKLGFDKTNLHKEEMKFILNSNTNFKNKIQAINKILNIDLLNNDSKLYDLSKIICNNP